MSSCPEKIEPGQPSQAVAAVASPATPREPVGASSFPPAALADAASKAGYTFSFPVTIYATATIQGDLEEEARNTIGCDLRDAFAEDEGSAVTDNGATIKFERFEIGGGTDPVIEALHQYRNDMLYPPAADSRERRVAMIDAIIARIDGARA